MHDDDDDDHNDDNNDDDDNDGDNDDDVMIMMYVAVYCAGDKEKGHPQYVEPPVIPGHEFVGEVVKLGPGRPF